MLLNKEGQYVTAFVSYDYPDHYREEDITRRIMFDCIMYRYRDVNPDGSPSGTELSRYKEVASGEIREELYSVRDWLPVSLVPERGPVNEFRAACGR